jgi:voltage-gated potassium channel
MVPLIRKRTRINLSYDDAKSTLKKRGILLIVLAFIHSVLFYTFENGVSYFDSVWVTLITFSTVGYGDISAATVSGKLTTMIFGTLSGIYILATTLEAFVASREEKRDLQRKGKWLWELEDHILIMNLPEYYNTEHISNLIKEIRKMPTLKEKKIQLVSNKFNGEPLTKELLNLNDVVHYDGIPSKTYVLDAVNIKKASHVLILSLLEDNNPDGYTFDIINRIREKNETIPIIAQCESSKDVQRLKNAGANVVLKPLRAYPEAIALTMEREFSGSFIEDFISSDGNELTYYPIKEKQYDWNETIKKCIIYEFGLPIAYKDLDDNVHFGTKTTGKQYIRGLYILKYQNEGSKSIDHILENEPYELETESFKKLLILNSPKFNGNKYFSELIAQLKKHRRFSNMNVTIVSENIDDSVKEKDFPDVNFIRENPSFIETLQKADAKNADFIFILNDEEDNDPDGLNFDIANRLKYDIQTNAYIVAEIQNDLDRERVLNQGVDSVIRPMRAYPAMLVRAISSKGSEHILEEIFDLKGNHLVEINNKDKTSKSKNWSDLVIDILNNDNILLLGYKDKDNIVVNPKNTESISLDTLYGFKMR